MARPIHPAAKARAAKFGCEIVEIDNEFALRNIETGALSEDRFEKVGEATETLAANGLDSITWAEEEEAPVSRSGVMAASYHDAYSKNPHGPGCNDDLDCVLRDMTRAAPSNNRPVDEMDLAKLHVVGRNTGLFREEWTRLNPGMQRMNLANRIRGWLRNNGDNITLDNGVEAVSGRFGIEQREKKVKARKSAVTRAKTEEIRSQA